MNKFLVPAALAAALAALTGCSSYNVSQPTSPLNGSVKTDLKADVAVGEQISGQSEVNILFSFLQFPGFNFGASPEAADPRRRDVERFLMAFDTGLSPAVGHQVTFDGTAAGNASRLSRLDTLQAEAEAGEIPVGLLAPGSVQRHAGVPEGDRLRASAVAVDEVGDPGRRGGGRQRAVEPGDGCREPLHVRRVRLTTFGGSVDDAVA